MDWFSKHHRKIILAIAIVGAAYLIVHFALEHEELAALGSVKEFFTEGGEHIVHIAPIVILFLVFGVLEIRSRLKKRKETKAQLPSETP